MDNVAYNKYMTQMRLEDQTVASLKKDLCDLYPELRDDLRTMYKKALINKVINRDEYALLKSRL